MASPDYTYDPPAITGVDEDRSADAPYDLGQPAKEVYDALAKNGRREQVLEIGRLMSELTITSTMPPQGYRTGDELPGNNQSVGAACVSTLASKLMFMAFPPGQPMMRLDPVEAKLAKEIEADPDLYARIQLSLSRLELAHRKKAATIGLATAWVGYNELLLVAGNALWKHVDLESPTYHRPDEYVVKRMRTGHPLVTIQHERVAWVTLDKVDQEIFVEEAKDDWKKLPEWEREVDIYTVCRLIREGDGKDPYKDFHWEYWQESCKGTLLPDSEVETDYDDVPMWPGWLRPSFGDDWGLPYCEKYRGDHYLVESSHSALNDGAALAAWALTFVKPGSRTSLKAVRTAKNLATLSGSAEDISVFKSEKTADFAWVTSHVERAERRLGVAYLLQSAARREGERVTAEEVQRVGQELDQAMGGLYTQSAQGNQRRMVMRFIKLHEESGENIPALPPGIVDVQVVTGTDAMGRGVELQALMDFVKVLSDAFPQKVQAFINPTDFITRLAANMGIKPEGLVNSPDQVAAATQAQQQMVQGQTLLSKAAGPVAGHLAKGAVDHMAAQQQAQQQQQPQEGDQANGN